MKAWLSLISVVVGLIPQVIALLQSIENAVPVGNAGAAKKQALFSTLQAWVEGSTELGATWAQIAPFIDKAIDPLVTLFNSVGLFKKST
jgi:hypothetical protein